MWSAIWQHWRTNQRLWWLTTAVGLVVLWCIQFLPLGAFTLAGLFSTVWLRKLVLVGSLVLQAFGWVVLALWFSGEVWLSLQTERQSWRAWLRAAASRPWPWLLLMLGLALVLVAGWFLFLIPVYVVAVVFGFTPFVFHHEQASPAASLKRSLHLVYFGGWPYVTRLLGLALLGTAWMIFGRVVLFGLFYGAMLFKTVLAMRLAAVVVFLLTLLGVAVCAWFWTLSLAYYYKMIKARAEAGETSAAYFWWQKVLVLAGWVLLVAWQVFTN